MTRNNKISAPSTNIRDIILNSNMEIVYSKHYKNSSDSTTQPKAKIIHFQCKSMNHSTGDPTFYLQKKVLSFLSRVNAR